MNINLWEYFDNYIGSMMWYGETNYDERSLKNMDKAYEVLYFLEDVKSRIINELEEHAKYRTGNASAIQLHKRAKELCKRFDDGFEEERWQD